MLSISIITFTWTRYYVSVYVIQLINFIREYVFLSFNGKNLITFFVIYCANFLNLLFVNWFVSVVNFDKVNADWEIPSTYSHFYYKMEFQSKRKFFVLQINYVEWYVSLLELFLNWLIKNISPSVVTEWNKFDSDTWNSISEGIFRNALLKFFRPVASKAYSINNPIGLKLLTRFRTGFSHLREHKLKPNFNETLNSSILL